VTRKVGVWIAGAYGNVATCVVAGTAAIKRGLEETVGLVSETRELRELGLVALDDLVFGGHEIRGGTLREAARDFGRRHGVLAPALLAAIDEDLARAEAEIRPGVLLGADPEVRAMASSRAVVAASPRAMVDHVRCDLESFRDRHGLDTVSVVNLISTEPTHEPVPAMASLDAFEDALDAGRGDGIPSSVLYAYAAVSAGFPFVDFTPSVAAGAPPVREMAARRGVAHMGRDGKTGETLLKTVLAPMFVARNLRVLSWQGMNMLGNRDGAVLRGAGALASKVRDKDEALRRILRGHDADSLVRIDYVPSLEDWKQAYDFVHFQGFLGARMQLHFLWQGCDSALAAPLVLDLVRLTDLARRRGEVCTLPQLACFFKTPLDVEEQSFPDQLTLLHRYAAVVRAEQTPSAQGRARKGASARTD
jgi:myo-inositol-1-phosphate synthase